MELEDYGLTVRIMDSYTSSEVKERMLLDMPFPYPGNPCSLGIELDGELIVLISIGDVKYKHNEFFFKISVWEDGNNYLESVRYPNEKADPNDLRKVFLTLAAPLLKKYQAHFTHSVNTHFNRLAQRLDLEQLEE